jgi:hypothetical protein
VDSTETAPTLSSDEREANDRTVKPEIEPGTTAGGETAGAVDTRPGTDAPGETAAGGGEAAPRPRRRRRRRRHPAQAATAAPAEARSEAAPGETMPGEGNASDGAFGDTGAAAEPGAALIATAQGGGDASAEAGGEGAAEGTAPDRPILRLRHRNRRRRRPAALGLLPGHSDPVPTGDGAPPAIAAIRAALAPGQRSFSVPRRQRRHAPLSGDPATPSGEAAPGTAETAAGPGGASPRPRRRRRRPIDAVASGAGREQTAEAGSAAAPGGENAGRHRQRGGPRQGESERTEDREGGGRERRAADRADGRDGQREHGQRERGQRDRRGDRGDRRDRGGRGAPPRRVVEQKLYSVDSIVDRGFEDVEEEGETRRVHWTIVKRTTADQISRKPVATVYVLQRDGADTEFPTLGTARGAVNKTIVHPEKLTPSKAERAIAKK